MKHLKLFEDYTQDEKNLDPVGEIAPPENEIEAIEEEPYNDDDDASTSTGVQYVYYINLDERGSFYADVRHPDTDETIYEIHVEPEDEENNIFVDGYMKHPEDIGGLEKYLKQLGIIQEEDSIVDSE